jgi:hypothetical protein
MRARYTARKRKPHNGYHEDTLLHGTRTRSYKMEALALAFYRRIAGLIKKIEHFLIILSIPQKQKML